MANHPNWRLPEVPAFTLESADFGDGQPLPTTARADGGNRSPALRWSGAPAGTKSFALTLYDPDAPTGSGFWHWAVYNLPGTLTELPADAGNPANKALPGITLANETRTEAFMGAAPPPGDGEHRYFFTLSALSVPSLDIPAGATPAVLGFMMRESIIGRAQLVGLASTPA
ncbi:YbhB/YbcL family Raf kinase inhibitor-like protein [soil metagenome]